jgi:alpha-galactosidase
MGRPANRLDRGVFDRQGDWVLWAAPGSECTVYPASRSPRGSETYTLSAQGPEITLVLMRDFYRNHRGLTRWTPDRPVWKKPVSGWCSWAAYYGDVTEEQMVSAADFVARELLPYGYDTVQMDDGFQLFNQGDPKPLNPSQSPADEWANANARFPHGLSWLAKQIADRGLTPGIWLSTSVPLGMPDAWYVNDPDGKPHKGPWVNWAVNGDIPEAVDFAYGRTIRAWKAQGWEYFKVDTIRHVLYDSYRTVPEYWASRGEDGDVAYRKIIAGIKREIGPNIYMLGCWGAIPEIAGVVDGCRIGEDVAPDWHSATASARFIARYNFLNNVVWRNDPDYMCFRLPVEEGRSWASLIALTGSQLMVSDPPADYDAARLDILRRVGPSQFVTPNNLSLLPPDPELCQLDVATGGESYTVLGRFAWKDAGLPQRAVTFDELGLDSHTRYLVWDFWNEAFVGAFQGSFPAAALARGECRVYAIRPAVDHPRVLSTNRHITQGAEELSGVQWKNGTLSGKMLLPAGRAFKLYVYMPDGYTLRSHKPSAGEATQNGRVAALTLSKPEGGEADWSLTFERRP